MKNATEKLREFREIAKISGDILARELDMPSTSYRYYEVGFKGEYLPRKLHKKMLAIGNKYSVDPDIMSELLGIPVEGGGTDSELISVPVYEFHAGMGGGGIVGTEEPIYYMPQPPNYLQRIGLGQADLIALEVRGDSMADTLLTGDQIMIDRKDTHTGAEGIFCLHDGDGLVVKRIERVRPSSDPVMLRLISDNKHHSTYDVPVDDVHVVGRVVWFGRRI